MSPLINNGDLLTIDFGASKIRKGDIVVFQARQNTVAHRVVKTGYGRLRDHLLTKGDRCPKFDEPVHINQLLGVVREIKGARGKLNMRTGYWRAINYMWAVYSFVSAKRAASNSAFWKLVDFPYSIRRLLLPKDYPVKLSFTKAFIGFGKIGIKFKHSMNQRKGKSHE